MFVTLLLGCDWDLLSEREGGKERERERERERETVYLHSTIFQLHVCIVAEHWKVAEKSCMFWF